MVKLKGRVIYILNITGVIFNTMRPSRVWIQLHEDVQPVLSGSQEALKFGVLESSGLDYGTARRSSSQREGQYSVEELLVRRPSRVSTLGVLGAESVSAGNTQSLFRWRLLARLDDHSLEKDFSWLFQVVVLKF